MINVNGPFAVVKDRLGPFAFYAIRELEKHLSPTSLFMALAPLAFARTAFSPKHRFPEYFCEPPSSRATQRAQTNYFLSRVLEFIPDRLTTAKWQARFQTTGLDRLKEVLQRKQSVVLVGFHFGAFKLMPFWLRALGIPVIALLRGESGSRSRAKRMKDKLSPFSNLPTVLYNEDQLRDVVNSLRTGHVLFLAADRETGKQCTIPINQHWSFQMATGAIRLAAQCDAALIPCCMIDKGKWQFRLDIGQPVPLKHLSHKPDIVRAAQHLLQELLPMVRQHPEHCAGYLINCFRPNVPVSVDENLAL